MKKWWKKELSVVDIITSIIFLKDGLVTHKDFIYINYLHLYGQHVNK